MTDPRPLAERVRAIAVWHEKAAAVRMRTNSEGLGFWRKDAAATLHQAADALENRPTQKETGE